MQTTAEVMVLFEESVLAVRELRRGEAFSVGEHAAADLPWPTSPIDLLRMSASGAIELRCAPSLSAAIELLDAEARPLPEGPRFVDEVDTGARVATLPADRRARVQLGAVSVLVGLGEAAPRRELKAALDLRDHSVTAVVAIAFLVGLLFAQAIPPSPASLAVDPFLLTMRGVRMRFEPPVEPAGPSAPLPIASAGAPAPARRSPAPRLVPRAGDRGASSGARAVAERKQDAAEAAATSGLIGIMRSVEGSHVGAVFGPGTAFGESGAALGELGGSLTGDVAGTASIDRLGARPGGEGHTVGLGKIGSGASGVGQGYTGGVSTALRDRQAKMISTLEVPTPDVHGPIDKELIRRAVRAQSPAFRFCYEKALQHDDTLAGRVLTQFTIAPSGRIVAAVTRSSTMNNPTVEACIADVFRRLELPSMPDGARGVAIVTYPLAFKSAGQ